MSFIVDVSEALKTNYRLGSAQALPERRIWGSLPLPNRGSVNQTTFQRRKCSSAEFSHT